MKLFASKPPSEKLKVDIHSHLVPGIDDGSQSFEQTLSMLRKMKEMGYKKVITTPHIISDIYPNSPSKIEKEFNVLRDKLDHEDISLEIEVAAEHYLDEFLMKSVEENQFLLFGNKYLLFETSFMSKPVAMEEFIFAVKSKGLIPVLAHPERYVYLQENWTLTSEIWDRGVMFQINISSLSGYYSRGARNLAEKLIDKKMVNFLGTDAHNEEHLFQCQNALDSKYGRRALELPLLNNSL